MWLSIILFSYYLTIIPKQIWYVGAGHPQTLLAGKFYVAANKSQASQWVRNWATLFRISCAYCDCHLSNIIINFAFLNDLFFSSYLGAKHTKDSKNVTN